MRVHVGEALSGEHNQIHIFHRDRAQEHFVAHDDGADECRAVFESQVNRTNVRNEPVGTVGQLDFLRAHFIQLKLHANVLGYDEMNSAGIDESISFDGLNVGSFGI